MRGGTERIRLRRRYKTPPDRIVLNIPHTIHKLLFGQYLALVEAAHPHIELALQPEGEAALDELHGFFKRNIRSGRDQRVKMVRHDDERMHKESPLAAVVEDGSQKQFRCGRDLKKAAAFGRHSGDQIRASFLRSELHLSSINERPAAKATYLAGLHSGV